MSSLGTFISHISVKQKIPSANLRQTATIDVGVGTFTNQIKMTFLKTSLFFFQAS